MFRLLLAASLLAPSLLLAADLENVQQRLRLAPGASAAAKILLEIDPGADAKLRRALDKVRGAKDKVEREAAVRFASDLVALNALEQKIQPAPEAKRQAESLKGSPVYRDPGAHQSSNWLGRALERLRFRQRQSQQEQGMPDVSRLFGPWLTYVMWTVLGIAAAAILWYFARHANWLRRSRKPGPTLLDEDEPERTLDEWLAMAEQLRAEGRYREAVRCLYLACLLRFDEFRVARFDRGQTNWEHLHRIEKSPKLPPELDFRAATSAFDRIWYGQHPSGIEDLDRFRQWYTDVVAALRGAA